jgi:hypothetical protein
VDAKGHSSGKTEERPAWQKVRKRLREEDVAALIVYTWSRAARNARVLLGLVDDLNQHDVRFIAVQNNIDTGTAAGRFQLTVLAGVDEYESNVASERHVETIAYLRRAKGRHYGFAPFGTVREKRGGDLVLVPDVRGQANGTDHDALKAMYMIYIAERLGFGDTAHELNRRGWQYRDRYGQLRDWNFNDVRRAAQSHWLYSGYVTIGRAYRNLEEILPGSHAPILPEHLTAGMAARLETFASMRGGNKPHSARVYPLTGVLFCAECGARLRGGADARKVLRYIHPHKARGHRNTFRSTAIDAQVAEHIMRLAVPGEYQQASAAQVQRWLAQEQGAGREARTQVDAALAKLKDLYVIGDFSLEEYEQRKAALMAKAPAAPVEKPVGLELASVPDFATVMRDATPEVLRDMARLLYERIELHTDGTLTYTAREWCKGWAS